MRVRGVGMFVGKQRVTLWAGLEPSPDLLALKQRIDGALNLHAGLAPDKGRFTPHITLRRIKSPVPDAVRRFVKTRAATALGGFSVRSFALFRSELRPEGAIHTLEERYLFTEQGAWRE